MTSGPAEADAAATKLSSSSSIQCRTGTGAVSDRWLMQPILAVAITCGRTASSVSILLAQRLGQFALQQRIGTRCPAHMNG